MYHNCPNLTLTFCLNLGETDWMGAPKYQTVNIQQVCKKAPLSLRRAVQYSITSLQEQYPHYHSIDLVKIAWMKPTGEWTGAISRPECVEQLDFGF